MKENLNASSAALMVIPSILLYALALYQIHPLLLILHLLSTPCQCVELLSVLGHSVG